MQGRKKMKVLDWCLHQPVKVVPRLHLFLSCCTLCKRFNENILLKFQMWRSNAAVCHMSVYVSSLVSLVLGSGPCAVMPEMQHRSYQWAEGVLGVLDWVSRIRWTQPTAQLFTVRHQSTLVWPWYTVYKLMVQSGTLSLCRLYPCLVFDSGRWTFPSCCRVLLLQ